MMYNSDKPIIKHIPNFLDYCEIEKGLRDNTQKNYQRYLNIFEKWLHSINSQNKLPHELTAEDVWSYRLFLARRYQTKDKKTLSKKSQNYYLIALRSLLDYFADRDINSLPASKVKLAKDTYTRTVKFLTLEQLERLLDVPKISTKIGMRDRAIMEALFSTGLRVSELVSLNREQIHFKDPDGLELTIQGKGGVTRTVYFSPRSLYWLKKYLDTRKIDNELALFINYQTKNDEERRLNQRSVQLKIKKYSRLAGIPIAVTPHVLRHSYATDLLMQGVDLRTVQEFLGHKNVSTTQIYTHITSKRLKEIHAKYHGGGSFSKK